MFDKLALNCAFIMAVSNVAANEPADVVTGSTEVDVKIPGDVFCGRKASIALALVKVVVNPDTLPRTKGVAKQLSLTHVAREEGQFATKEAHVAETLSVHGPPPYPSRPPRKVHEQRVWGDGGGVPTIVA